MDRIPSIPVYPPKLRQVLRRIVRNKDWGRFGEHGYKMQELWEIYNHYVAARNDYLKHALLCHFYDIRGGEPPPGREGTPPANLLPAAERLALKMLCQEEATWYEASAASGIPVKRLRKLLDEVSDQAATAGVPVLLKFEDEALGIESPDIS